MVRVRICLIGFVVVLTAAVIRPSFAALDFSAPGQSGTGLELVVVEAPGCIYCHLFHRDVVPAYEKSPRSKTVPMRFLDLNEDAFFSLRLDRPIESVPTVLVLRGSREIGRIPGYVGPMNFFLTINRMIDEAQ